MSVLGRPGPARAGFSLAFFKNANFGPVWAGPVGTAWAGPGRPKQDAFLHGLRSTAEKMFFCSSESSSDKLALVKESNSSSIDYDLSGISEYWHRSWRLWFIHQCNWLVELRTLVTGSLQAHTFSFIQWLFYQYSLSFAWKFTSVWPKATFLYSNIWRPPRLFVNDAKLLRMQCKQKCKFTVIQETGWISPWKMSTACWTPNGNYWIISPLSINWAPKSSYLAYLAFF